jgi:hypothetical protein
MEAWYEGHHFKGKEMKVHISKECWLMHKTIYCGNIGSRMMQ